MAVPNLFILRMSPEERAEYAKRLEEWRAELQAEYDALPWYSKIWQNIDGDRNIDGLWFWFCMEIALSAICWFPMALGADLLVCLAMWLIFTGTSTMALIINWRS